MNYDPSKPDSYYRNRLHELLDMEPNTNQATEVKKPSIDILYSKHGEPDLITMSVDDPHARVALMFYALSVSDDDMALSADLSSTSDDYEKQYDGDIEERIKSLVGTCATIFGMDDATLRARPLMPHPEMVKSMIGLHAQGLVDTMEARKILGIDNLVKDAEEDKEEE